MVTQENIREQLPLTEDEHQLLTHIYKKRFRFFIRVYLFLFGVAFVSALGIDGKKKHRHNYMANASSSYHYEERENRLVTYANVWNNYPFVGRVGYWYGNSHLS